MMRPSLRLNRIFQGFFVFPAVRPSRRGWALLSLVAVFGSISGALAANASLQIVWEAPSPAGTRAAFQAKVLKEMSLPELEAFKQATLSEVDPFGKGARETAKFQGVSLSALVDESTKNLTAADRSTTDLLVLKTRSGREILMPKAFLVKYPQIQLALKRNGQPLGAEAPRVVLPATTNAKIRQENMLLNPLFVSELTTVTLSSYERRYGAFLLKRRTDPSAMRGEKLFLQNCVICHSQPQVTMAVLTSSEKVQKVAAGNHPEVPGSLASASEFKNIFDKKSLRSLVSYLEAFRFETAKN